jgi:hypothetical protein
MAHDKKRRGNMEMEKILAYVVVLLALLMTTAGALAQDANPCASDIARFCSNLRPGKGAIADCLQQNEAQLSPECRQYHLAEIGSALRKTHQACEVDSVKFCGSYLQPPDERLLQCLKLNAPSLSPDCRTELFKALDLMHY